MTVENGRERISRGHRRDREEWDVLIVDHHEGYVYNDNHPHSGLKMRSPRDFIAAQTATA